MRPSQHTESEILHFIVEADAGVPVDELCRRARISQRTFYRWRLRYGGMTPKATQAIKNLQLENMRLRSILSRMSAANDFEVLSAIRPSTRCDLGTDLATNGASLGRFASIRGTR